MWRGQCDCVLYENFGVTPTDIVHFSSLYCLDLFDRFLAPVLENEKVVIPGAFKVNIGEEKYIRFFHCHGGRQVHMKLCENITILPSLRTPQLQELLSPSEQ